MIMAGDTGTGKKSNGDNSAGKQSQNSVPGVKSEEKTTAAGTNSTGVNKMSDEKNEHAEADVPEDFFDDFLKEDFMAGLDIVDEDMGETCEPEPPQKVTEQSKVKNKPAQTNVSVKNTTSNNAKKKSKQTSDKLTKNDLELQKLNKEIDEMKKGQSKPDKLTKSDLELQKLNKEIEEMKKGQSKPDRLTKNDLELQKLNKELEEMKKVQSKKPTIKPVVDADNFDIRRDPDKTRKAIQNDKIKSAKDKEKRLITNIVETGLVPPGMELEMNLDEVAVIEKPNAITDLRQKLQSRDVKKPKDDVKNIKENDPKKLSTTSRSTTGSGKRTRSPPKKSPQLSKELSPPIRRRRNNFSQNSPPYQYHSNRSPLRRSPFEISPLRRNISPLRRRSKSPVLHRRSRSRSFNRRSPIYGRSNSRDRFMNYRRRRDRSISPSKRRNRRTRSRSPRRYHRNEKNEKVSFLQEIVAKLNETHPMQQNIPPPYGSMPMAPNMPMVPNMPMAPMPMHPSIPATGFFTPAPMPQQPPPRLQPPMAQPPLQLKPQPLPQPQIQQKYDPYDESFFIGSSPVLPSKKSETTIGLPTPSPSEGNEVRNNLPVNKDKLFGEQRIKLSDFLAITAKPQANSSTKLQEKVKVIQRCQEAIKVLNEKKFVGPLTVIRTDLDQESSSKSTVSPLLRKPIIQLPFTSPGARNSQEIPFKKICDTLLYQVGIDRDLLSRKASTQEKPIREVPWKVAPSHHQDVPTFIKAESKNLGTQTDKELSACKECFRRKGILYKHAGIQSGDSMLTFSVSTQVTEADFYSMIPKNKSLASLTPAQLLGKQSMMSDKSQRNGPEIVNRLRHIPSPPPAPPIFFAPSQIPQAEPSRPIIPPLLYSQTFVPPQRSVSPKHSFNDGNRWGGNSRYQ